MKKNLYKNEKAIYNVKYKEESNSNEILRKSSRSSYKTQKKIQNMKNQIKIVQGFWDKQTLANAQAGDIVKLKDGVSYARVTRNATGRLDGDDKMVVVYAEECGPRYSKVYNVTVRGETKLKIFERDGFFFADGWQKANLPKERALKFREDDTFVTLNDSRISNIEVEQREDYDFCE